MFSFIDKIKKFISQRRDGFKTKHTTSNGVETLFSKTNDGKFTISISGESFDEIFKVGDEIVNFIQKSVALKKNEKTSKTPNLDRAIERSSKVCANVLEGRFPNREVWTKTGPGNYSFKPASSEDNARKENVKDNE